MCSEREHVEDGISGIVHSGATQVCLTGGELNAALAQGVVRIQSGFAGRGPTRAQAFYRHNFVVVVTEESLTTAERTLVADGRADVVLDLRGQLQNVMREDLIAMVERLTGCRVLALLSDNQADPDIAAQLFVLDRSIPDDRPVAHPASPG
jgi:uncharacterized protein YbcI